MVFHAMLQSQAVYKGGKVVFQPDALAQVHCRLCILLLHPLGRIEGAIIAGCAVLDINDYNGHYEGDEHNFSPGKGWEQTGTAVLLGYNWYAPLDDTGKPVQIVLSWKANRGTLGDVGAWMKANADNNAWNACAIIKDSRYLYHKKGFLGRHKLATMNKEDW
ncbi:MAG: hypothetical protein IKO72_08505 [Kiritimatiellae bacterium]|nr:hypothetical protein [Kiritimatiellia bacterium]